MSNQVHSGFDKARQQIKSQQRSVRPTRQIIEKPVSVKNHSEVDKVSYESASHVKREETGAAAFKTGLDNDERVYTSPYNDGEVGTSRLKGKKESTHSKLTNNSAVPMNPVDKIDIKQTGPQKYEPSPIRDDGSFEGCYNKYDQAEVFIENSEGKIDIDQIEKNLENEDMLAITQHNQQMVVQNANLEQLTEEEGLGQTSRDEPPVVVQQRQAKQTEDDERYSDYEPEQKQI